MKQYIVLLLIAVAVFLLVEIGSAVLAEANAASRRATDSCNLKLIALATITTADANYGVFPRATIPNPNESPNRRLSWLVTILPNMSCDGLYGQFDLTQPWNSETNLPLAQRHIPSFLCPSAEPQVLAPACSSLPARLATTSLTSYVGMSGIGPNAAFLPEGDPRCGAFGHERRTLYPNSFTRGTSQTILVIETTHENGPWAAGHLPTLREIDPEIESQIGPEAPFGHTERSGPFWRRSSWSRYTQVGLGDGSTRVISDSMSTRTLAAAATIAGGEILGQDW